MAKRANTTVRSSASGGVALGAAWAAICSFLNGNTLGWVMWHSVCSWLYIIYLLLGFGGGLPSWGA